MKRQLTLAALMILTCTGANALAQTATEIPPEARYRLQILQQTLTGQPGAVGRLLIQPQLRFIDQLGLGAWWTNAPLLERLGVSENQRANIQRVFENHRSTLELNRAALEKEETQLARLLEAEPFDRNAALNQTYKVIQARSDMERTNALMTLEMREHLTSAQWMQLPRPGVALSYVVRNPDKLNPGLNLGGGGRGARGGAPQ